MSAILKNKMNDSLENAFAALGLSDSESDDTLTPVGEPHAPIGRASRMHSDDPNDRIIDEEGAHYDTPRPAGRAFIYEDSDIKEECYPPVSSTGYPRGGSELLNSQKRGGGGSVAPSMALILGLHSLGPVNYRVFVGDPW